MKRMSTRELTLVAVMIAMVFVVTRFAGITLAFGYFNLGDSIVMVTAIVLGKRCGLLAGAFGSALSDLLTPGYVIFAPVTFVVKGLEGYVVAYLSERKNINAEAAKIIAVVVGSLIMIAGYFIGETFLLSLIDKTYGYSYAINELRTNIVQGGICSVLGYAISTILIKADVKKYAVGR